MFAVSILYQCLVSLIVLTQYTYAHHVFHVFRYKTYLNRKPELIIRSYHTKVSDKHGENSCVRDSDPDSADWRQGQEDVALCFLTGSGNLLGVVSSPGTSSSSAIVSTPGRSNSISEHVCVLH